MIFPLTPRFNKVREVRGSNTIIGEERPHKRPGLLLDECPSEMDGRGRRRSDGEPIGSPAGAIDPSKIVCLTSVWTKTLGDMETFSFHIDVHVRGPLRHRSARL